MKKTSKEQLNYYLSLGSNLGDRRAMLAEASTRLALYTGGQIIARAPIYETTPIDCTEGDPNFFNTVVFLHCEKKPTELLEICHSIETELGRSPTKAAKNSPRTIDIDILFSPDLPATIGDRIDPQLPHPRMHQRLLDRKSVV